MQKLTEYKYRRLVEKAIEIRKKELLKPYLEQTKLFIGNGGNF